MFFTRPISLLGRVVEWAESAEHVGVIRSIFGNESNILDRIMSHKRALGTILHAGIARNYRGNPSYSLKAEQMCGSSVLFSGLGSLVLTRNEIEYIELIVITHQYLET